MSGKDFDTLLNLARQTLQLLKEVPGVLDPSIEQEGPQAQLRIVPDRRLCARYNINIEDVSNLINTAMGGNPVGTLYEGERNFDIVAKLDRKTMASPEAIGRLPVHSADGTPIPLSQVASIDIVDGQTVIARGDGIRHLTVRCDVTGRDEGSFVAEAQKRFEQQIELPPGYKAEWLGMFANLQRAYRHFLLIIPATVGVIFLILAINFGSFRAAFVLLLPIPFAFASGVLALWLRDMHMNVSTGVGFATLFGVAIMDGVLMIQGITKYRHLGYTPDEAIVHGRVDRLRPGLMTTLVAVLGLLPASLAVSLGSDVQRPLATVIIYGLTVRPSLRCSSRRFSTGSSFPRCAKNGRSISFPTTRRRRAPRRRRARKVFQTKRERRGTRGGPFPPVFHFNHSPKARPSDKRPAAVGPLPGRGRLQRGYL
ncbi:MAG: efflux RND transporter permease subunit [Thermoguttaceae bacterium]|nr:efflux RND transporter permease subunit [Thermoguttaceae bacterium]